MYSQFRQDEFVAVILGGMRRGFFIESGAYDGITSSNTLLFERHYGWQGLCVEANDAFYRRLTANRHCICIHACLYDRDGEVDFLESAASAGGIVREFSRQHTDFVQRVHAPPTDDAGNWITVPKTTRALASLLDEHHAPDIIDYWSLDTEGSELAILASFPFDRYAVRVLTVEHCWVPQRRAEIARFLQARGYVFLTHLGIDDCYIASWAAPRHTALRRRRTKR